MAVSLMCQVALIRQHCVMTEMGMEANEERMETRKEEAMRCQLKSKREMPEKEVSVTWQGKSLVATREVEMGEVLLLEAAVLELPPEKAKVEREVKRRVEMLSKEELQRLVLLQKRFPVNTDSKQCCYLH